MSVLVIGSGLFALAGIGMGLAARRFRRGARAVVAPPAIGNGESRKSPDCPVCLALGAHEARIKPKNGA
ncbi:MAG: hypothetical protein ACRETN_05330 [Nevskiales bacterium]